MCADKFRVLAVDDERDILDLINITLSPHYDVLTLTSPADVTDILAFFEPELIILDVMMPKVTGYQILEFVRKTPKFQHTLVIFLSAKDSSRDVKYGYKLGANVYLTKPFQPERLLKNAQMLLEHGMPQGPTKKTFSMRDVALRMQMKGGLHMLGAANSTAPAPGAEGDASGHRLKRPLAQEAQEAQEESQQKKWMG